VIRYVRAVAGSMCTSCGRDDEPVSPVRRVYLVAGDGPAVAEGLGEAASEPEAWCSLCRDFYPYVEL